MAFQKLLMPKLYVHSGRECPYCRRPMDLQVPGLEPTRDHHPIPRSRGGTKTIICCYTCNNIKGDMSAPDWDAFMQSNPEWWAMAKSVRRKRVRGVRVIRQPENPSAPLAAAFANARRLADLGFVRKVAREFEKQYVEPLSLPVEYDDPEAQQAFEGAYKDRLSLLRIDTEN